MPMSAGPPAEEICPFFHVKTHKMQPADALKLAHRGDRWRILKGFRTGSSIACLRSYPPVDKARRERSIPIAPA